MKLLFCLSQAYAISWLFVGLSLFTTGSPTQAEHFLPALGELAAKRERTTNNEKPWNGIGLVEFFVQIIQASIMTAFVKKDLFEVAP